MRNRETNIKDNKEMSKIESKYGVNTFLSEVHDNTVDFDDTFKVQEYQHLLKSNIFNRTMGMVTMK